MNGYDRKQIERFRLSNYCYYFSIWEIDVRPFNWILSISDLIQRKPYYQIELSWPSSIPWIFALCTPSAYTVNTSSRLLIVIAFIEFYEYSHSWTNTLINPSPKTSSVWVCQIVSFFGASLASLSFVGAFSASAKPWLHDEEARLHVPTYIFHSIIIKSNHFLHR